ncbi:MAG: glycogen/starch synthase, partial [Pseudomonadales bacterium]|nr:glycogen/starch synthase [Pseudomonadales bacterium]
MRILMVAAENGALPGGKVGGIGDVIRDVPTALARAGHQVDVVTPGYQSLSLLPGTQLQNRLTLEFAGALESIVLFKAAVPQSLAGVEHWLVENRIFAACGVGMIYCNDGAGPFATDARKFALFCHAVCHALVTGALPWPDVIHLHDWHGAPLLFLRKYLPAYRKLLDIFCVYSVHNLSLQGVRPFSNNESALESWFPIRAYNREEIADPVAGDCVNMMRMGINLADRIHVVSPTYAREILLPSIPEQG